MDGAALSVWAMRQSFISAIFTERTVWNWLWSGSSLVSQDTGLGGSYNSEEWDDSGQTYNYEGDITNWIPNNCAHIPFVAMSAGRQDLAGSGGFNTFPLSVGVLTALKACHAGYAFAWNNGDHTDPPDIFGSYGEGDTTGKYFGFYESGIFASNVSYPAFFNFSLDNDYGSGGDCSSGSPGPPCFVNAGWHWSSISDTGTSWSATVTNPNITTTATADLTPRNTQNFVVAPGQTVNWTATGGQGGSVQADSYGLVTIPLVTFTSGATVVTLTLQP